MDISRPSAFAVSHAKEIRLSRRQTDRSDLRRPFIGVRADASATELEIIRALMEQLPGYALLIGASAAKVWGLHLPEELAQDALTHPVVGVPRQAPAIRRQGITCRRIVLGSNDVFVFEGLRVSSLERIWVDLSAAMGLEDFVAFTDALIGWGPLRTGREALREIAARFLRTPGARNRRLALELADSGAESWMESVVRVRLIMGGLPRPQCNPTLVLGNGRRVRPDMFWPEHNFALEYSGGYHHSTDQLRRDESRYSAMRSSGLRVLVINKDDIWPPDRLLKRVRDDLEQTP